MNRDETQLPAHNGGNLPHASAQEMKAAWLRLAAEGTDDGLVVLDRRRRIMALNPAAADLFAANGEDDGQTCRGLFGCGQAGPSLCDGEHCLIEAFHQAEGEGRHHVAEFRRPDGDARWLDLSFRRLSAELSLLTVRDVSAEKSLEQIKAEFVAQVAHELRALTLILGYADLLTRLDALDEPPEVYAEAIRSEARHLVRLVNDLLDFSRMDTGRFRLELAWMDMVELVDEVVNLYAVPQAKHTFRLELPPQRLPLVYADQSRVRQVLVNLISNAVKYSPGGGDVVVSLSADEALTDLRVSVCDQGIGIAAEDQARIFTAFYRTPEGASKAEGLGLGLAVSQALVEAHGGRIWVESQPGVGSTFTFALPVAGPAS